MLLICIGIAIGLGLFDITLKQQVEDMMDLNECQDSTIGSIEFRRVHNYGFAMNLLEKKQSLVRIVSIGAGILLAIYELILFLRKGSLWEKIGGAMALGGAFSNIYDRVVRGYVVDYFGFKTKWKRFSKLTFNLGDAGIIFGTLLMAIFRKK